jgi:hypothetical protein
MGSAFRKIIEQNLPSESRESIGVHMPIEFDTSALFSGRSRRQAQARYLLEANGLHDNITREIPINRWPTHSRPTTRGCERIIKSSVFSEVFRKRN